LPAQPRAVDQVRDRANARLEIDPRGDEPGDGAALVLGNPDGRTIGREVGIDLPRFAPTPALAGERAEPAFDVLVDGGPLERLSRAAERLK
jgi:hypothetical protein